ncbi:MAG: sulfite exporter TauE/SafE family protein [Alphaproteobacteria bacterium]
MFALMCVASFFGSLVAGTMGLGGGVMLMAIMAMVFPPAVLIPLHGVVQLGSNLGRTVVTLRHVIREIVPAFVVGAVLGAVIGANMVVTLPTAWLQLILALFVVYAMWGPRFRVGTPSKPTFFGVGLLGSFATMFVGTIGPLLAPFVAAASTDRQQVVATQAGLMTMLHGFKIVAFGVLGFAFATYAGLLAGMLVFGFLGTLAGSRLLLRMPEKAFRIAFRVLLTLLAVRLGWGAASKLIAG